MVSIVDASGIVCFNALTPILSWIPYTAGDLQGEFIFESNSEENPIALLKSISVHKNFNFQTVHKYLPSNSCLNALNAC